MLLEYIFPYTIKIKYFDYLIHSYDQFKPYKFSSKKFLPKDNEDETKLIKKLADTVKNGTAFNNSGVTKN